ncbi:Guanylate cyclase [Aphelenchoides besseyi]|nr:Guanylate cyclase [Aphelenchoides besseyi]
MLFLCIIFSLNSITVAEIPQFKAGILIPYGSSVDKDVGFCQAAGAIPVGIKKAIDLQIYNPKLYNVSFSWYFDNCDESFGAGDTAKLITNHNVTAIFGPVCPQSARVVGAITGYNNVMTFPWGIAMSSDFFAGKYKTVMPITMVALAHTMNRYNWTKIGFVYNAITSLDESIPICGYFSGAFESGSGFFANGTESYTRQIKETSVSAFQDVLRTLKARARIIVLCIETIAAKRNILQAAINEKMTSIEYVYLFIQTNAAGFASFMTPGDPASESLKQVAKNVLILDRFTNDTMESNLIKQKIGDGVREWPFYSNCSTNTKVSNLAFYLGDSVITWLIGLNMSYTKYGPTDFNNTTLILKTLRGSTYELPSLFASYFTFTSGIRVSRYTLNGLDADGVSKVWAIIHSITNVSYPVFNVTYNDSATTIWANRNGFFPQSTPVCGFQNERCLASPIMYTVISAGGILVFLLVVLGLFVAIYLFNRSQTQRLNALWQINYLLLDKNASATNTARSTISVTSSLNARKDTDNTQFVYYNGDLVVALKRKQTTNWTADEQAEFRKITDKFQMRRLDHNNLNRFIGVSITDRTTCLLVWQYCERGNIIECIEANSMRIDSFIMVGMIKDIVEGLYYIHNSSFIQHGNLSPYKCLVSDRFEIKLQCYGCNGLKCRTQRSLTHKGKNNFLKPISLVSATLYVAPEHLRDTEDLVGSQAGDVYSFAIVASLILTMKLNPFDSEASDEEIITKIARADYPLTRPSLKIDPTLDVNPELITYIRRCFAERPEDRPNIEEVRSFVAERILGNKSTNVMDHMFSLMENNAADLEQDVQNRQAELMEEKRKADIILYRMMPKHAADKLKQGQIVDPEVYSSCTIFFSDIVSFTVLASKSSPLQIINFLNDVYSLADDIIGAHDAYKVETIGVPRRNGFNHVKSISDMALDFLRSIKKLRLDHLPNDPIRMRVGVHTGSSVAGIVGMTAPRFCVFGDTVNIAAKMEASGRAGRIHITESTKTQLEQHYRGQYIIAERGESLIKNIGTMRTFWLVPPEEANDFDP